MGSSLFYYVGKWNEGDMLKKEFELALKRKVRERLERGFIRTYKPVMDDASYRIFNRMKDYKHWCGKKLPIWLGYGKAR
jgi:ribosome modulation factor